MGGTAGLLIGALLSVQHAPAQDAHFPGYDDLCGYPVIIGSTPSVSEARRTRDGRPIIILDRILTRPAEARRRMFLIAHECAHHVMGHVSVVARRERAASHKVVRDQEMSADCWAAETLARAGLDPVIQTIADRFYRAGLYSPGGGYPSGVQRSTIIRECAAIGRRARVSPPPAGPATSPDRSSPAVAEPHGPDQECATCEPGRPPIHPGGDCAPTALDGRQSHLC